MRLFFTKPISKKRGRNRADRGNDERNREGRAIRMRQSPSLTVIKLRGAEISLPKGYKGLSYYTFQSLLAKRVARLECGQGSLEIILRELPRSKLISSRLGCFVSFSYQYRRLMSTFCCALKQVRLSCTRNQGLKPGSDLLQNYPSCLTKSPASLQAQRNHGAGLLSWRSFQNLDFMHEFTVGITFKRTTSCAARLATCFPHVQVQDVHARGERCHPRPLGPAARHSSSTRQAPDPFPYHQLPMSDTYLSRF
jgi:hypothetical protein